MRAQWGQNAGSSRGASTAGISVIFLDSLKEVMQELRAGGMALTLTENRSWWYREVADSRKEKKRNFFFPLWWLKPLFSPVALLQVTRHESHNQFSYIWSIFPIAREYFLPETGRYYSIYIVSVWLLLFSFFFPSYLSLHPFHSPIKPSINSSIHLPKDILTTHCMAGNVLSI